MNASTIPVLTLALTSTCFLPACETHAAAGHEAPHEARHKIVVTTPVAKDVVSTQQYVCQIHSRRHIEVRALETGYLQEVHVQEGQAVKKGDVMFGITPVLFEASLETERAEAQLAQIRYDNTQMLSAKSIVSPQELALAKAELAKANAKVKRARAELNFTSVAAPFDGIVDRQHHQQGSLVGEGDILSTLSDNEVMWVYFNVPEARYLEYKTELETEKDAFEIELKLANGQIFKHPGKIGAIEADFDNETGNIAFRADFPNPEGLLRHGQTGTILIHRPLTGAIVIPQRATYEILAKKYAYVVEPAGDKSAEHAGDKRAEHGHAAAEKGHPGEKEAKGFGVIRQREIVIAHELDDIYVIEKGLSVGDKIVFEGIQQVRDGDEVDYEPRSPEKILSHLKYHAE